MATETAQNLNETTATPAGSEAVLLILVTASFSGKESARTADPVRQDLDDGAVRDRARSSHQFIDSGPGLSVQHRGYPALSPVENQGSVATLELRRSLVIASAKLDRHRAEQTKNEAME